MTSILKDQDPVLVTDSRLLKKPVPRPILRGATSILYKQWPATTASPSAIHFSTHLPVPRAEIDRQIQVLVPVRASITAVWSAAQNLQYLAEPQKIGIRSYPIHKALERIDLTINNHGFSFNSGEIISGLEHFNTSRKLKLLEYSKCATYGTCQSQAFDDIRSGIRSGLAPYVSSISGIAPQNFPFTVYLNQQATSGNSYTAIATVDFVSIEALFVSPLYWGAADDNYEAFAGVDTIDVSLYFNSTNPQFRMIAIQNTNSVSNEDRGGTITGSLQVTFTSADNYTYSDLSPKLFITYLKQQCPMPIDKPILYPYYHLNTYRSVHSSTVTTNSTAIVSSDQILLSKLPTRIYIWARKPDSTFEADPFTPDAFCGIENLKIMWNNRIVLSEAHKGQLYDMSIKNGLQYEYGTWCGYKLNNENSAADSFGMSASQFEILECQPSHYAYHEDLELLRQSYMLRVYHVLCIQHLSQYSKLILIVILLVLQPHCLSLYLFGLLLLMENLHQLIKSQGVMEDYLLLYLFSF